MRKTFAIRIILLLVFTVMFVPAAYPQNNRSAVSVTGNDAATCTVPDPCRTFGVAQSRTNPNGEIVALTSGGYGPFTIDKSVTVVAAPGIYAALVAPGVGNAIDVNATGAKVVIRGLHLYGMGTGGIGINIIFADEVHIENCVIDGFSNRGMTASANARISQTTVRNCATAIAFNGAKGTINHVEVRDSVVGIDVATSANVTARDSVVAGCSTGFVARSNGQLNIENSVATNNSSNGIESSAGTVRVSNTMVTDNGNGLLNASGSTMVSWGNNKVQGNTTNISGTITVVAQD